MTRPIATDTQHVLKDLQKILIIQSYSELLKSAFAGPHYLELCFAMLQGTRGPRTIWSVIRWQWNCVLRSLKQVTPELSLILSASNTQNYSHDSPEWRRPHTRCPSICLLMATDWRHWDIIWEFQVSINSAWEVNVTVQTRATSSCLSLRTISNTGRTWNKAVRSSEMKWNLMLLGKALSLRAIGPCLPAISVPSPLFLPIRTLTAGHTLRLEAEGWRGEHKAFLRYMVFYFKQCGTNLKFKH